MVNSPGMASGSRKKILNPTISIDSPSPLSVPLCLDSVALRETNYYADSVELRETIYYTEAHREKRRATEM